MRMILKQAGAAALAGVVVIAMSAPSEARHGRNAAIIGGLAAGAIVGAAVAGAGGYYGPGYGPAYYEPGYAVEPGYVYEYAPAYHRYDNPYYPSCAIDMGYGRLDYSGC